MFWKNRTLQVTLFPLNLFDTFVYLGRLRFCRYQPITCTLWHFSIAGKGQRIPASHSRNRFLLFCQSQQQACFYHRTDANSTITSLLLSIVTVLQAYWSSILMHFVFPLSFAQITLSFRVVCNIDSFTGLVRDVWRLVQPNIATARSGY